MQYANQRIQKNNHKEGSVAPAKAKVRCLDQKQALSTIVHELNNVYTKYEHCCSYHLQWIWPPKPSIKKSCTPTYPLSTTLPQTFFGTSDK